MRVRLRVFNRPNDTECEWPFMPVAYAREGLIWAGMAFEERDVMCVTFKDEESLYSYMQNAMEEFEHDERFAVYDHLLKHD